MHPAGPHVEYVIAWRYRVAPKDSAAFEHAYGPRGGWVDLFATAVGYRGTELFRGERAGEYVTLDRWDSKARYQAFRSERAVDYERLDAEFEALTESESLLFDGTVIAP